MRTNENALLTTQTTAIIGLCCAVGLARAQLATQWVGTTTDTQWEYTDRVLPDGAGNVYTIGRTPDGAVQPDWRVEKRDRTGNLLWSRHLVLATNGFFYADRPRDLALDQAGNLLVCGAGTDVPPQKGVLVRFTPDGTELSRTFWANTQNDGPSSGEKLRVAPDGSIYVMSSGYQLVKLDAAGRLIWSRHASTVTGPPYLDYLSVSLVVDADANAYIGGWTQRISPRTDIGFTAFKFDPSGTQVWEARSSDINRIAGMVMGSDGALYTTGYASNTQTAWWTIGKYSAATGARDWRIVMSDAFGDPVTARSIATDNAGRVVVVGTPGEGAPPANGNITTIVYDGAGARLWSARYNSPIGAEAEAPDRVTTDRAGDILVLGRVSDSVPTTVDQLVLRYSPTGALLDDVRTLPGRFNNPDWIVTDAAGNAYTAGNHQPPFGTLTPRVGFVTKIGVGGGCPSDLDNDGSLANGGLPDGAVTIEDLLYFIAAYEGGTPPADLDNDGEPSVGTPDGAVTIEDLIFFLARFDQGC